MEPNYLNELNDAQREAVVNIAGPSLIIAGAGSGKTRVLTYRIAHLMRSGVNAGGILALTFTNKAAREMKERIATIVGNEVARSIWMGTFHSIFSRILRNEAHILGYPSTFTIYDTSDSKSLIRSIMKEMGLNEKVYKPGTVLGRISQAKNNLITSSAYRASSSAIDFDRSIGMPKIVDIYNAYEKRCKISGAMDFDDLLLNTNLLFHQHPEVAAKYQSRFSHILVDEYQDTNFSQYLIVKKLAEKHKNICVVGDDAQSIYSFRGARIENILNFKNDYPNYNTYRLEQNYRSTQTIVNAANSIIAQNKRQLKKNVFSENELGEKIKVIQAITDNQEGQLVIDELNEHRLTYHDMFSDYAILYRTNSQSRIFEESLRKLNLPYKIYGGLSFYERKEIKDILAYLRITINNSDNEAFKRIINYPARGIGQTSVTKIEMASSQRGVSMWDVISDPDQYSLEVSKGTLAKIALFSELINSFKQQLNESSAYELALVIARKTEVLQELYKDKTPENLSKFENVQELMNAIQDFTINAKEEGRPNGLENYLEEVALITDQDNDKDEDRNRVTLMTVHSSKGLEFKNVFIVGVEDKLFPSNFSGILTQEALEEERRLFYVALTRAEKRSWISFSSQRYKWGQLTFCEPSQFISEIDPTYLILPAKNDLPSFLSGTEIFFEQKKQTFATPPVRKPIGEASPQMNQRLMQMRQATSRQPLSSTEISTLNEGDEVEHQRFGKGKILSIEGIEPNQKATVLFPNAGRKQLLLKYANLRKV